jgi:hypothetical protein
MLQQERKNVIIIKRRYNMQTRIIIAGSRSFNDYEYLKATLLSIINNKDNILIISGTANGADKLGEKFAKEFNLALKQFPANWNLYGKQAGNIRNKEMLDFAIKEKAILVAFWDGKSTGTKNMIQIAKQKNIERYIKVF